jgi:1-acyl-sn-glycerol-3-phosphate acyltransferase
MSGGPPPREGALAYVRSALFAVWMFGSALVLGTLCLPLMLGPRKLAYFPPKIWARGVFAALRLLIGIEIVVRGRERFPVGACLIASKHQGMLDTLVAISLAEDPSIVLKKSLMRIPIFGWYCWKVGMIPIDRDGGPKTVRKLVIAAREVVALGRQVVIYPEGTRRPLGAEPDYKRGIGLLYKELGVVCAPIATNSGRVWPAHGLLKHPGVAVFEVLAPISPGLAPKAFMSKLEHELEQACRALL